MESRLIADAVQNGLLEGIVQAMSAANVRTVCRKDNRSL